MGEKWVYYKEKGGEGMESGKLRIGCVVMAAGRSRRFGGDKLSAVLDGETLLERALEAVPAEEFCRVVVVGRGTVLEQGAAHGFETVENDRPEKGLSRTVRLGLERLLDCDGVLFQVADQPRLRRETVAALAALWRSHPDKIVGLSHRGVRGNPCLFPHRFFRELLQLEGDTGGGKVIRDHTEDLLTMEAPEEELFDVDDRESFDRLKGE